MADHDHDGDDDRAPGSDPDAPWRPGYRGPEPVAPAGAATADPVAAPPAELPDRWSRDGERLVAEASVLAPPDPAAPPVDEARISEPSRPNRLMIAAVVGVVAVGVVAVAALVTRGGDVDGSIAIPDAVDELWSIELEPADSVDLARGVVVVNEQDRVRALDASTGEPLWTFGAPVGDPSEATSDDVSGEVLVDSRVSAVNGIAVVNVRRFGADGSAHGIDLRTGEERWVRSVPIDEEIFASGDSVLAIVNDPESAIGRPLFSLLDPVTGESATPPLRMADLGFGSPVFTVEDPSTPGRVALIDEGSRETLASGIDASGLVALTVVDGRLVAAIEDGSLALLDEDGDIVDQVAADVGPAVEGRWLQAVAGTDVAVLNGDESLVAFRVVDDELEIAWGMPGELTFVHNPGDEPLLAIGSARANETWLRLVDPRSGDAAFEIEGESSHRFWFRGAAVAADGLVYTDGSAVRALDRDGAEIWSIDGDVDRLMVDDGVIVVLTSDELTAYG